MRKLTAWVRDLTPRQSRVLALTLLLTIAALSAGMIGRLNWAVMVVALIGALAVGATMQVRRRLEALAGQLHAESARTRQALAEVTRTQTAKVTKGAELRHRRLLAAVENERLAADDHRQEIVAAVKNERLAADDHRQEMVAALDRHSRTMARRQRDETNEVEALLQLFRDVRPRAPMPPSSSGFALNPTGLLQVLHLIKQGDPKLVLELGSGISSVWVGYALEASGGRLVTIDHDSEFAAQTRSLLAMHGLAEIAEVRHAPLTPIEVDGEKFDWYDPTCFADLSAVELLLIDGPPASTGSLARYPAMRVLAQRLSPSAKVVLDDATRPAELEAMRRWLAQEPNLTAQPSTFSRQAVFAYHQ